MTAVECSIPTRDQPARPVDASPGTNRPPLSLLVLSTTLNEGGAQRFTSTLLRHLDRRIAGPRLCVLRPDIGYPLPDDVPLHAFAYYRYRDLPRTIRRLRALIEEVRPDVLLSNVNATNLAAGMALRRCRHQPAWIARIAVSPADDDDVVRRFLARRTYPRVDRFVANSAGLVEGMAAVYPFSRDRIRVIPNPTDFDLIDRQAQSTPEFVHTADGPLLIAVGRLYRQKRCELMIDAFARVAAQRPGSLWICGEGPCRPGLEERIRRLGLGDRVRLLGFCKNPYALLKQATLFLMSSDWEGLPNGLIEAQGLGLPAIATRCPYGPEEIIEDGQTGLLVPVGNVEAFADALRTLLDDADLRARMSQRARESTRRRFAAAPLTRAWERLLLEVVEARRARHIGSRTRES